MGPKKGKKKGGKKKKGGGMGDDVDPMERNFILQAEVESLTMRLIRQQEEANHAKASEIEKRQREKQLKAIAEEDKKRTQAIVADMTRQHKATSEELQEQYAALVAIGNQNEEDLEELIRQKETIEVEKKTIEEEKEKEIKTYRQHIDQLQTEFGSMLGDTLVKIKAKIEDANKQWKEENDAKILKGYEEIANRNGGQN